MNQENKQTINTSDPNYIFTEIFHWFINRWSLIENFRQITQDTDEFTRILTSQSLENNLHEQAYNTENKKFLNQDVLKSILSSSIKKNEFIKNLTDEQMKNHSTIIDATSIILAHNILDTVAIDFLKLISEIDKKPWLKKIKNRKVEIKDLISNKTKDDIINSQIEKKIIEVEKESLIKKIDLLISICRPPKNISLVKNYKYNKEKLEELDKLRHKNVHGKDNLKKLPNGENDLQYLYFTFSYMMALVSQKYNLQLAPEYFQQMLLQANKA